MRGVESSRPRRVRFLSVEPTAAAWVDAVRCAQEKAGGGRKGGRGGQLPPPPPGQARGGTGEDLSLIHI